MIKNLFKKSMFVGLDISDRSAEAAKVEMSGGSFGLISRSRTVFGPGIVEGGRIADKLKLKLTLTELLQKINFDPSTDKLVFSLPEEICYAISFDILGGDEAEEEGQIREYAKKAVPIKPDNAVYSYRVNASGGKKKRVALIAADRADLDQWKLFFDDLGLKVDRFDVSPMSARRSILRGGEKNFLLVDLGSVNTRIYSFKGAQMLYPYSFSYAGDFLTAEISEERSEHDRPVSLIEADRIKTQNGLANAGNNPDVMKRIEKGLSKIVKEIDSACRYFKEKTGEEVGEVVLVGGGSKMKGLVDFFDKALNAERLPIKVIAPDIVFGLGPDAAYYFEAVGAALGAADRSWEKTDPFFLVHGSSGATLPEEAGKIFNKAIKDARKFIGSRSPKIRLATIIAFCSFLLIGAAYLVEFKQVFRQEKTIDVSVIINTDKTNLNTQGVEGRIISISIANASTYSGAMVLGRMEAEKGLHAGEGIWREPLNQPADKQKIIFPVSFDWLVFPRDHITDLVLAQFKESAVYKAGYPLKTIIWDSLNKNSNPKDSFTLKGKAVFGQ